MKRLAIQFLIPTGLLLIQARLPSMSGLRPDLLLVYVFVIGLRSDQVHGIRTGALAGLMIDLFSGMLIGPHMLAKGLAGYLASRINRFAAHSTVLLAVSAVALIGLVHEAALAMIHEAFQPPASASLRAALLQTVSVSAVFLSANALWKTGSIDEKPI